MGVDLATRGCRSEQRAWPALNLVVREDQVVAAAVDGDRRGRELPAMTAHSMCQPGRPRADRGVPRRFAGAFGPPQQRVQRVALARPFRIAAALGGQVRPSSSRSRPLADPRTTAAARPRRCRSRCPARHPRSPGRGRRCPCRAAPRRRGDRLDRLAHADVVRRRDDAQLFHVVAEQLGLARRPARASRPRWPRRAPAAGRRHPSRSARSRRRSPASSQSRTSVS